MKRSLFFMIISLGLCMSSCEQVKSFARRLSGNKNGAGKATMQQAVVISDDVFVTDASASDTIAVLGLGEPVTVQEHGGVPGPARVVLSDGRTEGIIPAEAIVTQAVSAAVIRQVRICRRPDSISVTEDKFEFMDMVAVVSESEGWLEVIGEDRYKRGWIPADYVTKTTEDVADAIYARRKLREANGLSRKEKLEQILLNGPYIDTYIMQQIRNMKAIEDLYVQAEQESYDFGKTLPESPVEE
jgi:hypothetical protein